MVVFKLVFIGLKKLYFEKPKCSFNFGNDWKLV